MAVSKNVGRGRATSNQRVGNVKIKGRSALPFQNDAAMRAAYKSGNGVVASASGIKRAGSTAENILLASSVLPLEAVVGKAFGAVGKAVSRAFPRAAKYAANPELRIAAAANRVARNSRGTIRGGELQAEYLASRGAGNSEMARALRGIETGWGDGATNEMARKFVRAAKTSTFKSSSSVIAKRLAAVRRARGMR